MFNQRKTFLFVNTSVLPIYKPLKLQKMQKITSETFLKKTFSTNVEKKIDKLLCKVVDIKFCFTCGKESCT